MKKVLLPTDQNNPQVEEYVAAATQGMNRLKNGESLAHMEALQIALGWEDGKQAELLAKDIMAFAVSQVERINTQTIPLRMIEYGELGWQKWAEEQKQAIIKELS